MKRHFLGALVAILAAGGLVVPASATVTLPVDLDGLASYSSEVIVGRVVEVRSHWNQARDRIHTTTTFADVEFLKGAGEGGLYRLTLPGGEIGELGMAVPGTPRFVLGQRALLFLNHDDPAWMMPVVGWSQGRFHLLPDGVMTDSGAPVVDVRGGRLVVAAPSPEGVSGPGGSASAGSPVEAVGRFEIVPQYPDREEAITGDALPGQGIPARERPALQHFGGDQAQAPPVGQGPVVLPGDAGHGGPMSEAAFLEIVRELIAAAR